MNDDKPNRNQFHAALHPPAAEITQRMELARNILSRPMPLQASALVDERDWETSEMLPHVHRQLADQMSRGMLETLPPEVFFEKVKGTNEGVPHGAVGIKFTVCAMTAQEFYAIQKVVAQTVIERAKLLQRIQELEQLVGHQDPPDKAN